MTENGLTLRSPSGAMLAGALVALLLAALLVAPTPQTGVALVDSAIGVEAAEAKSYETDGNYDFRRWRTTTRDTFYQGSTGPMHVHVLTDGNHNGFWFTVDAVSTGWNPIAGAWCSAGATICAAAFPNIHSDFYRVGMAKNDRGNKNWADTNLVNVTAIRVGTTDF